MILETDIKWHRTPLLNFFSLLKVPELPVTDENFRHQFPIKLTSICECFNEKFLSRKSVFQGIQRVECNKVPSFIRLEISKERINDLLKHKQICAADIRCLDSDSKQRIRKLCLQNCLSSQ